MAAAWPATPGAGGSYRTSMSMPGPCCWTDPGSFSVTTKESNTLKTSIGLPELDPVSTRLASCKAATVGPL